MARRPRLTADHLATAAILAMTGIALAHGYAAQLHYIEAAEHAAMGNMADEAASLTAIARALVVSAVLGLAVAAWGVDVLWHRRATAAWTAVVLVGYGAMVAAGIASRTSVGLAGHTDDAGPLWAVTVAAELAVMLAVAAYAASVRATSQGAAFGGAIVTDRLGVVSSPR
jgi:hypothetical protein